jgi:tetratricopeptide (TPR) repeat protein
MQFLSYYYSGKLEDCRRVASGLLTAAREVGNRPGVCIAQAELAIVSNFYGEFQQALDRSNQALEHYDDTSWAFYTHRLGWEPSVVANCQKGIALLSLGRLEDAQAASARAIILAEALGHPAVDLYAYCYGGLFPAFLVGDFAGMRYYAARCIPLGKSYNVPQYVAWSDCLGAVAIAEEGKAEEAVRCFESGRRVRLGLDYIGHGAITKLAGAFVYSKSGDIHQALQLCDAALQESETSLENWVTAELWRVRGDLFRTPDLLDLKTAEDCYRKGLAVAKKQGSLVFALKCAMSLSRLLQDLNREREALTCLEPVYESIVQGRDFEIVRKAQTLLDELRTSTTGRSDALLGKSPSASRSSASRPP